jgi:hypothetical protein
MNDSERSSEMRIMGFLRANADTEAGVMPTPEEMQRMDAFMQEVAAAGIIESTDGLTPSSRGKRIALSDGKYTVTDGPFPLREVSCAYAIYNVQSWEEAERWTRRFLDVLGGGECELRPFFAPEEFAGAGAQS